MPGWNPFQKHCKRLKTSPPKTAMPSNRASSTCSLPGGRVTACSVYRSSGARPLDARGCVRAIERFRFHPARRDGIPLEDQAILPVVSSVVDNFHEMGTLISFGETRGVDSVRLDMIQNTGGHLTSDYAPMHVADENHPLHTAFLEKRSAIRASACRPHIFTMPRTGANARWQ